MRSMRNGHKFSRSGFTLLEFIAVMSLILLIATISVPRYTALLTQQRLKADAVTALEISRLGEAYLLESSGQGDADINHYIEESFGQKPVSKYLKGGSFVTQVQGESVKVSITNGSQTIDLVENGQIIEPSLGKTAHAS